jgi:hypothetical protein
MQKYYKAEMDKLLRIMTRVAALTFIIPLVALGVLWYKIKLAPAAGCRPVPPIVDKLLPPLMLLVAGLVLLTAYITKALAPKGYDLNDVELRIDRGLRPITIPVREITEVSRLEDGLLRRSLRLMGASGYYGYYGLFWNSKLGRFRAYATRFTGLVAVRTAKTLYVITPDDTEDFVATLGALIRK